MIPKHEGQLIGRDGGSQKGSKELVDQRGGEKKLTLYYNMCILPIKVEHVVYFR